MKKIVTGILAILLIAAAWYLISDESNVVPPPVTGSDALNSLLREAPIDRVDLTLGTFEQLDIPLDKVMALRIESNEMLEPFSSTQSISFGDNLVVMEFLTDNVAAYGNDGTFKKRLSGDFMSQAASISANNDSLYIYDYGNKVIHTYDRDLNYSRSFPFFMPYYTQGSLIVNDTHIAFQREEASGFRVGDSGVDQLLSVADIEKPNAPIVDLVPRIVPSGKHPGGYNNLIFSMNSRSDIAVAYPALPYMFVYRNFEPYRILKFESPAFETVDNPDLKPFEPVMGEAVRIDNLLGDVHLMENGDILLFSSGVLHYIQLQRNGGYQLERSFELVRGDSGEAISSVSSIDVADSDSDTVTIYLVSAGLMFEVELPE